MILGVLQARTSSSRFPGKVLRPLLGTPMLLRQLERIGWVRQLDALVVATSEDPSDDVLAEVLQAHGVPCFRGPLDDVLSRVYLAAKPYRPQHIVRLTGDCPICDPALIDRTIQHHLETGADYTSTGLITRTYPDGMDTEVVKWEALEAAWREARLPSEREHVLPFVHTRPERFARAEIQDAQDRSSWRLSVDEPEDFALVAWIYEQLYPSQPDFGLPEIVKLLEAHPRQLASNQHITYNAGYAKSLLEDRLVAGGES